MENSSMKLFQRTVFNFSSLETRKKWMLCWVSIKLIVSKQIPERADVVGKFFGFLKNTNFTQLEELLAHEQ